MSRIFAAFTDVFAGQMVDKTTTRWGRFRPYFLFAGVPLMLLAVATFRVPAGQSEVVTLVYAYATYMLFNLCYSFVNIPFGSLASAMTQLPDERARLSAARSIGTAAAIIGLTIVVSPQINRADDLQRSLTITTLTLAVLGVALYLFLFRTSRENVERDTAPVTLKQSVRAIGKNRPLLLLRDAEVPEIPASASHGEAPADDRRREQRLADRDDEEEQAVGPPLAEVRARVRDVHPGRDEREAPRPPRRRPARPRGAWAS